MPLSLVDIEREVQGVRASFETDAFTCRVPTQQVDARCAELARSFHIIATYLPPLLPQEQGIVTLSKRKTAALIADRVWGADTILDPAISLGWHLPSDIRVRAFIKLFQLFEHSPRHLAAETANNPASLQDIERELALAAHRSTGASVQPLYSSTDERDAQYRSGDQAAVVCVVDNLQVVDEGRLTWEQVIEFRRDRDARNAYRAFVHWLDKEMLDKPITFISDEVAGRLDLYQWSLRKHGILTVLGSLSNSVNPKALVSASTVAMAVELIAKTPLWSLLSATALIVGRVAISAATALVERADIESANREIAYVHQLKHALS